MPNIFEGPFGNPLGGQIVGAEGIGASPLDDMKAKSGICCPKCAKQNYDSHTNQYGLFKKCRECKQEWTGGTMAVARPDFLDPIPPPGVPAHDIDRPVVQYTGAAFRDPDKTYDDGGDY